jgi:hypothetical protein
VKIYRDDNKKIMKAQGEILQILNILQSQANKYFGTKQVASDRQMTSSKSHNRRDDNVNDR